VCQVLAGHAAPGCCCAEEVGVVEGKALEREANVFAGELLMPEPAVRDAFARAASVCTLAGRFSVSEEAMHRLLYNMGLVEAPPTSQR